MRYVIVAGGTIDYTFTNDFLKEAKREHQFIIACDKGYEACEYLGVAPDIVIGDFDSAGEKALEKIKEKKIAHKVLNPIKDDTDTEAALHYAIEKSHDGDYIYILGGTGTRVDHLLGNIALLGMGLRENRNVILLDRNNNIRMIKPGDLCRIDANEGKYVSVVPYMGPVSGLTMEGFKYPLKDATVEGFNTLTISNEVAETTGKITIDKGNLIVIESID